MSRLIAPTTDFRAVRDGRNSQIFYVDVALDSARSVAAGTQLVINMAGNSFYCDANPNDGNCLVHFQDTNFDKGPLPLYVSPGAIFNIPFTQILIENTAQAGKKVRLAYGIDVDFQPGSVAQLAVTTTIAGGYTSIRPEAQTGNFSDVSSTLANTPLTVFTPAANANGAIILSADISVWDAVAASHAFITKASAPASITDGSVILHAGNSGGAGAQAAVAVLGYPQYVEAGKGLYFITNAAQSAAAQTSRNCRFKLL